MHRLQVIWHSIPRQICTWIAAAEPGEHSGAPLPDFHQSSFISLILKPAYIPGALVLRPVRSQTLSLPTNWS